MFFYIGEQENPYKYVKKSDLFVLLSDSESFSLVINEALTLNIPVITTDIPALRESVKDGENGFVVSNNTEEIAEVINICVSNTGLLIKLKENIKKAD